MDVVGRGVPGREREGLIDSSEELETEVLRLVGFTTGVGVVVAGGKLEDGRSVDIVYAGEIEDVGGVGWVESDVLPFQTN